MHPDIQPHIEAEAVRIVEAGAAQGVILRLLGGLAIRLRCPSFHNPHCFSRNIVVNLSIHSVTERRVAR